MHKPNKALWTICKHVLRYLQGKSSLGIMFREEEDLNLNGYSDLDWGQEQPDRKFIGEFCYMVAGGLINWRSKKQTINVQSSKEAEFIALAMCVRETL